MCAMNSGVAFVVWWLLCAIVKSQEWYANISRIPTKFLSAKQEAQYANRQWRTDRSECDALIFSRKMDMNCLPNPTAYELLALLVTGTSGTGTRSVARLLRNMGIGAIGHEKYAAQATVSWTHAVNDFTFGVPYPFSSERTKWWRDRSIRNKIDFENTMKPRFAKIVHLTRCPMDVLKSLLPPHAPIARFVQKVTQNPPLTTPCAESYDCQTTLAERLGWATSFYVAWNEHIERFADKRLKVEELMGAEMQKHAEYLCELALAFKRRSPKFIPCATRAAALVNKNHTAVLGLQPIFNAAEDDVWLAARMAQDRHGIPTAENVRHRRLHRRLSLDDLRKAQWPPGVNGEATLDAFTSMTQRYGYAGACAGEASAKTPLYWNSRERRIVTEAPRKNTIPEDDALTRAGIERCLQNNEECSVLDAECPDLKKYAASRDCLKAAILFRTSYRRIKCCFRCCVRYWLDVATRLGENIRFHANHVHATMPGIDIGYKRFNPDHGDVGLGDPVENLLAHPHAISLLSDVHVHPVQGCHTRFNNASHLEHTIVGLYHFRPDMKMIPPDDFKFHKKGVHGDPWTHHSHMFRCIQQIRNAKSLIVDVFEPTKNMPEPFLDGKISLFFANNVDHEPLANATDMLLKQAKGGAFFKAKKLKVPQYLEIKRPSTLYGVNKIHERVIGVRGVSLWQAFLEHPDLSHVPTRNRLLLCCCMNVDAMHPGRMENTRTLSRFSEFFCPVTKNTRGHHIGFPFNDPGVHEIEAEIILMLNEKYGNRKSLIGNYDTHMPLLMHDSKFVYSPKGVGEQCYRDYEALVSGAIPVVDDSVYEHRRKFLRGLPIVIVSNWSDITPEYLNKKWNEMERTRYDVSILYLPYWYDLIIGAMGM